jgi:hypothetical protein
VPLSVQLGLLLALATAFVSILGFLYKYRGAVEAPAVEWRHPIRSTMALFASKWWTIGIIVATSSWFLHVAALSLAPISLVQSVIAGGLVMLTVVAERMFGIGVTRREWIGVGLTALGLAFLAATLGDTGDSKHADYETATLAVFVGGVALASFAPMVYAMGGRPHAGALLGAAAGMQWGASDVAIKAASGGFADDGIVATFFGPLTVVITVLSLVGLVVSARSLQIGDAVPVIAITSAAANLCTIASGLVVFGEPLPDGSLSVGVRMVAFTLVVVAAALTPGPVGAAERSAV